MANFPALLTDVPAELTAVTKFVQGIETLVADAKSQGLSTVTIAAIESLVPDGEAVLTDTDKVITDL